MVPWSSPGQVLRWWRRDVLGLSQQQAADRLAVQPSALSNWEHGARAISLDIETLDELLSGEGALSGLLWAFGSTKGLDALTDWSHVFPGGSTPVWMWIRAPGQTVDVEAEWGVFRMETRIDSTDENGLFVTLGASVGESPLTVKLSKPGWVDFGRGVMPDEVPASRVLSAVDLMSRSSANGRFMDLFVSNLAGKLSGPGSDQRSDLVDLAPRGLASFFSGVTKALSSEPPAAWAPLTDTTEDANELDRLRFARLRRSRGLSLANVVDLLATRADVKVGKETLRRFETDVGQPHDRLLPAALDQVLGGGGSLAMMALRSDRGSGSVGFPDFWLGPVWLEFDDSPDDVVVILRWGDWSRKVRIRTPALLAFTCSMPEASLRIATTGDVRWTIGIGRRAGATSIDHNWDPSSVDNAQRALSTTESALMRALNPKKLRGL